MKTEMAHTYIRISRLNYLLFIYLFILFIYCNTSKLTYLVQSCSQLVAVEVAAVVLIFVLKRRL